MSYVGWQALPTLGSQASPASELPEAPQAPDAHAYTLSHAMFESFPYSHARPSSLHADPGAGASVGHGLG